ncbi:MAG: transglutaminase family protein [Cytophagales bacterium]|nr:transglutaminase family protein [Cytophagales bacterium]
MSVKVAIRHQTHYIYDRAVSLSPHVFRLRPAPHCRTKIDKYTINISPKNHYINWMQDPFGNYQARVVFPEQSRELYFEVELIANMEVINPFDFFLEEYAEYYPFTYDAVLKSELVPYLTPAESGSLLMKWINDHKITSKMRMVDFLVKINQQLSQDINYTIRMEPGVQLCEHTLGTALGSCRDTGWLLVQICRHYGLAARFVSGYLVQLTADEKPLEGPAGTEKDFTDLHAWCEVYIPGAGWIGLDPTSGLFAGEGHIPLACTPDYHSAAAVTGAIDPCESTMTYRNEVVRIYETPRVTKPLTESQWNAAVALGYKVEQDLKTHDVQLTMGGEPTFVSATDMESAQWNTAADGEEKRTMAYDLILKLKQSFAPKGLLHVGMGKWYPGELLPRWQYSLYWRKDGVPICPDENYQANPFKDYGFEPTHALKFMEALVAKIGVKSTYIHTAYEDVLYYLWSEGKVPSNINVLQKDLKSSIERQYLADLLVKGLNKPIAYVLPLKWSTERNAWLTCQWKLRKENLYLIPGNSPVGLRLPLDSLIENDKEEIVVETDLFAEVPLLNHDHIFDIQTIEKYTVRTALTVEARNGKLYIFLPPLTVIEKYLQLLSAVYEVAKAVKMPVIIEGYTPPSDNRIEKLVVSPDPGVIEVNIHPASSWGEILHNYDTLFQNAKLSKLGTQKFMLDGRHTGTGGGNHITIGGAKPSSSPLLRRPDLIKSFIIFWQHHPSLSYLFSGAFIGPTSQAPRVDEGRIENLYELEIALSKIPEKGEIPYWLTDRLLRNLLTDLTGNTHRAEFCIDKLYSPDSTSGRLGILEFRAFDMPPHYHMCMLQLLLIRALLATFWQKPYQGKLIRWGTELHDRFLLPHYCHADMTEVVSYLQSNGYDFDMRWFDSFFEFRFPKYGSIEAQGIQLDVNMAIEPWHVLGEEATTQGTARYVDSSHERVQVKLTGLTKDRYALMCNGKMIALKSTGKTGEYVSGIKYKAWNPYSSLHPTIGVQSPLVFDIVDKWNKKSIGGCKYFVSHPGGRSYDTLPVNSMEAESRRINRFWDIGHTPDIQQVSQGPASAVTFVPEGSPQNVVFEIPNEDMDNEHVYTVDLRA